MPHTITVAIHTYGAEQFQGRRVRKVSKDDVPYLERIGWTLARRTGGLWSSYDRMYPPADGDTKRPEILLTVPTDDEIKALANELHAAGQTWRGEVCGWAARYTPYKVTRGYRSVYSSASNGMDEGVELYESVSPSELTIGGAAPWSVTVRWNDGENVAPYLFIHGI